jgi:FtsP/CotA-like multicopper oxidase with cupredoxin domain
MLRLAPAERICVTVDMQNPGIWILGEVRKHVRVLGMAVAVEYAAESGIARWQQPQDLIWNYGQFAAMESTAESHDDSPVVVPLTFDSRFRGHGSMEAWTINGKSYPDADVISLVRGGRYRLRLINRSMDDHPVHLHRHSFELHSLGAPLAGVRQEMRAAIRGIVKDVVLVDSQTSAEVDFIANEPGPSLFHCHQQNHMDLGFMMLFDCG